jgi:hypothetical protein
MSILLAGKSRMEKETPVGLIGGQDAWSLPPFAIWESSLGVAKDRRFPLLAAIRFTAAIAKRSEQRKQFVASQDFFLEENT